jgi:hypothetical protein
MDWTVIDKAGRVYIAFSESDAFFVRDSVGGSIYFQGSFYA